MERLTRSDKNSTVGPQITIFRGSSNGRTAAFEAVNLGSSPSPRAKKKLEFLTLVFVLEQADQKRNPRMFQKQQAVYMAYYSGYHSY